MNEPEETWDDEPKCPVCGEKVDPPEELEEDQDETDWECLECGARCTITLGHFFLVELVSKGMPGEKRQ